ncbi:MAG: TIGR01457 family HAD-type hydrolase [Anaerolineae bacterium]|nr:TIGR01457 family HAD-type hydrolase [Anaerolineae bacterium]MDW8101419.1 TIGR01457 family HAD-type hydrolase [Anaerolineae bacterium]
MAYFKGISAFIVDMDGVLYRGNTAIPGAKEFISTLEETGRKFLLLTNNSSLTPAQYEAKLEKMGIKVQKERIFTSAQATAFYLRLTARAGAKVFLIGMDGIREALLAEGFTISEDKDVDFVVVGIDYNLSYEKLKKATLAIRAGAVFIGTNPDKTLPTEEGLCPGNGAILAALEASTDVKPITIGKPSPLIFELALKRLGSNPQETAVVGDRLETDILGAHRAGLKSILVLSGATDRNHLALAELKPDFVFESVKELAEALRGE